MGARGGNAISAREAAKGSVQGRGPGEAQRGGFGGEKAERRKRVKFPRKAETEQSGLSGDAGASQRDGGDNLNLKGIVKNKSVLRGGSIAEAKQF